MLSRVQNQTHSSFVWNYLWIRLITHSRAWTAQWGPLCWSLTSIWPLTSPSCKWRAPTRQKIRNQPWSASHLSGKKIHHRKSDNLASLRLLNNNFKSGRNNVTTIFFRSSETLFSRMLYSFSRDRWRLTCWLNFPQICLVKKAIFGCMEGRSRRTWDR